MVAHRRVLAAVSTAPVPYARLLTPAVCLPCRPQVRAITQLMRARCSSAWAAVEVRSVDGFQGREKEVIVFSAVRSNPHRRVGFLADARRLNVALTRAKRGLLVVGDAGTLSADSTWASWLQWARRQGVVVPAEQLVGRRGAAVALQ